MSNRNLRATVFCLQASDFSDRSAEDITRQISRLKLDLGDKKAKRKPKRLAVGEEEAAEVGAERRRHDAHRRQHVDRHRPHARVLPVGDEERGAEPRRAADTHTARRVEARAIDAGVARPGDGGDDALGSHAADAVVARVGHVENIVGVDGEA